MKFTFKIHTYQHCSLPNRNVDQWALIFRTQRPLQKPTNYPQQSFEYHNKQYKCRAISDRHNDLVFLVDLTFIYKIMMDKNKTLPLSNSLQNLLFPPGRYTIAQLLNLTPYFNTGSKLTLQRHKELMKQLFDMDDQKLWWVVKGEYGEVDAKVLLLILMLQLMSRERRVIFNQGISNIHAPTKENGINPNLTSPRNRATRALYISNQQTEIMGYIKEHFVTFLKLLSNEPNAQDPYLEGDDLQSLNFLFKVDRSKKFSSYLPIFSKSQKLKASTISDHIVPRIVISQQELISYQGLSYVVTIKDGIQNKDLRIIGCEDSEIFINSQVRSLYVVNCVNCTIYVAACERIAFIDKCQKVSFTVATNLLRVCNTHDSNIYYYGSSPIILTGDNKALLIGPNNSPSPDLAKLMKQASIPVSQANFNNFQQVLFKQMVNSESSWAKMPPSEFDLLVLPSKQDEEQIKVEKKSPEMQKLLAPKEYLLELQRRNKYYSNLKKEILKSNLSPEMTKHLHSALQGNFRQWLTARLYTKNLNDLVKMLDRK